jgi:serine/threonine-protein kinase RsbW
MTAGGSNRRTKGRAEEFSFTIDSLDQQRREVEAAILEAVQRHGFDQENYFAIRTALDEALVNAIKHGNRRDPAKKVHVEASVSDQRVEIFIEDEGPGFNRSGVPDPTAEENLERCSGRGILLMESYMDSVSWDRDGRRVRLVKENV